MNNPKINAGFIAYKEDSERMAMIKHTIDFLSVCGGGTEIYRGREMPDVLKGMIISQ